MISTVQIVSAGLLTGLAIAIAGRASSWDLASLATASAASCLAIIAWRVLANAFALNQDFIPAISPADLGCLPLGAAGPALLMLDASRHGGRRALPVLVGGLSGFMINVVIL
jgi:hypothetical protein